MNLETVEPECGNLSNSSVCPATESFLSRLQGTLVFLIAMDAVAGKITYCHAAEVFEH